MRLRTKEKIAFILRFVFVIVIGMYALNRESIGVIQFMFISLLGIVPLLHY